MRKPLELYIHIPFCVKKCAYCDFLSAPSTAAQRAEYVDLLCEEIRVCGEELRKEGKKDGEASCEVTTVFFGGGTPSILSTEQIEQIMTTLRGAFTFGENVEISLEMNPGTVTEEKLMAYRRAGINRLSIGLQSVHNEELKMLGRIHTYEEFLRSYQMARKAGFQNINVDLISAIPGQTLESWEDSLRSVANLAPEHISAYSLIIEPGTLFYDWFGEEGQKTEFEKDAGRDKAEEGRPALPGEEEERKIYHRTKELLSEYGYERYEISNYAKPGYECRHNLGYWERVPYLGFGVGAASLFRDARYSNPADIEEYRRHFTDKFHGDRLGREEMMEEFVFLGLRKIEGISGAEFKTKFGQAFHEIYREPLEKMKKLGFMEVSGDRIALTEAGIDVSNAVFVEFLF
ncbi:radical SAM family heme chaperone HemW [Roseburia hominis]